VVIIEPGPIITEWSTISRDSLVETKHLARLRIDDGAVIVRIEEKYRPIRHGHIDRLAIEMMVQYMGPPGPKAGPRRKRQAPESPYKPLPQQTLPKK
jgi:hypothetical protein